MPETPALTPRKLRRNVGREPTIVHNFGVGVAILLAQNAPSVADDTQVHLRVLAAALIVLAILLIWLLVIYIRSTVPAAKRRRQEIRRRRVFDYEAPFDYERE